jgi:hypothetical protein
MTTDYGAPGELFNGAVFVTENVTEPLYATITLEASPYPQQVLVLVQGGDGDVYEAAVTSEDFDSYYTSTDESNLLKFVSDGGAYQLEITPTAGGASLQVSIFSERAGADAGAWRRNSWPARRRRRTPTPSSSPSPRRAP